MVCVYRLIPKCRTADSVGSCCCQSQVALFRYRALSHKRYSVSSHAPFFFFLFLARCWGVQVCVPGAGDGVSWVRLPCQLAPRPSVRETRVQIPSQHGNLVKFILVWVFFNPAESLPNLYPAFLLSASRPFNRWPSVWFGSLSPLTAKWQATSAAEPNLRVTSTQLG